MTPEETAAWRVVSVAAAAGDVTAIGMQYVHLKWIEAGIDRVDEQLGMQLERAEQGVA